MPQMKSIYSSHIDSIGYDADGGELHVKWDDGNTTIYSGVPSSVASDVMNSASIGEALHSQVRKQYPHRPAR